MRFRNAKKADSPQILNLAKKLKLDYSGMEADDFLVAEDSRKIVGICALKKHKDCLELCSLGVDENYRKRGLGKKLVLAVLKKANGEIYLATIIPKFFKKFGFEDSSQIPLSMVKKSDWCQGCKKELCTIMVKKPK
jgi:N-acetylglutamate synthase-like GNAT family acetyltransferase